MALQEPLFIPMLAIRGSQKVLSEKGYLYEPKLDGIRALCYVNKQIRFINRRLRDITLNYPELAIRDNIKANNCILDGEIVVYNDEGIPDISMALKRDLLKNPLLIAIRSEEMPAVYVAFDIVEKDGQSLMNLPLIERKKILEKTVKEGEFIEKIVFTFEGQQLWREVIRRNLEGVMAKQEESLYYPNRRTDAWQKIKQVKTADCVIVGFTQKKRKVSSLALAIYQDDTLQFIGKVGTGFDYETIISLYKKLKPLIVKTSPLGDKTRIRDIIWVKPKLVCEVEFLEITKDGKLRSPVFVRLRTDKKPKECTLL